MPCNNPEEYVLAMTIDEETGKAMPKVYVAGTVDMTEANKRLDAAEERLDVIQERVVENCKTLKTHENVIDNVQATYPTLLERITTLETNLAALTARVEALETPTT